MFLVFKLHFSATFEISSVVVGWHRFYFEAILAPIDLIALLLCVLLQHHL